MYNICDYAFGIKLCNAKLKQIIVSANQSKNNLTIHCVSNKTLLSPCIYWGIMGMQTTW